MKFWNWTKRLKSSQWWKYMLLALKTNYYTARCMFYRFIISKQRHICVKKKQVETCLVLFLKHWNLVKWANIHLHIFHNFLQYFYIWFMNIFTQLFTEIYLTQWLWNLFIWHHLPNVPGRLITLQQPKGNYYQQNAWQLLSTKIFFLTERSSVATTVPSSSKTIIGALVYLWICDPGPSNPTTFLGLCSPSDYR